MAKIRYNTKTTLISSSQCQRKHPSGRPCNVLSCKVELAEGVQAIMAIDFMFRLTFITPVESAACAEPHSTASAH